MTVSENLISRPRTILVWESWSGFWGTCSRDITKPSILYGLKGFFSLDIGSHNERMSQDFLNHG